MTQQQFYDLSKRYLEGNATEEERTILVKWFEQQSNQSNLKIPDSQKHEIEKRMWRAIQKKVRPTLSKRPIRFAWMLGVAASLILVFVWFNQSQISLKINHESSATEIEQVGIEIKNTTQVEQETRLEDGTVVLLKKNSSIIYDKAYNQTKREVYLKGEAFFKVKRDVSKPFIVRTGELVTEVLGTSFRIKHHEKANTIEVAVTTGKVSVYAEKSNRQDERNGVILTPNQRVVFDVASKNIVPSIVEIPVPIMTNATQPPHLVFQEASLQTVLNTLSQLYGIEFVIANPKAKECQITADLNGLSMFTQLELVCKSIDATYEKRGTVIFINGDGC